MEKHFLLGDVAKILGRKPHHVTHLLVTGKIPEPEQRIGNMRLFTADDVVRLARHFRVSPNWSAIEANTPDADVKAPVGLTLRPPFEVLQVGENGHEVRDGDGVVFAWTGDRGHALVVAGLLEVAAKV
jgi:MerR HTH family regulatory protein